MKAILFLLFVLINFIFSSKDASLNVFLDKIQQDGTYEVLLQVKRTLGTDIAIEMCKAMVNTNFCKEVIIHYMK